LEKGEEQQDRRKKISKTNKFLKISLNTPYALSTTP
jgi:hypothetical protein